MNLHYKKKVFTRNVCLKKTKQNTQFVCVLNPYTLVRIPIIIKVKFYYNTSIMPV